MKTFEGIKISGLWRAEIEKTETALREKIGEREYKIHPATFRRDEKITTEVLPVVIRSIADGGSTWYYIAAVRGDGTEINLCEEPYTEWPYKSTPAKAWAAAELSPDSKTCNYQVFSSVDIDGTGKIWVEDCRDFGESSIYDPGYCGSSFD